ncbi:hypothetical protein BDZ89DRAFT_152729 [Hymenopellis radicata]|nr:hypothetical protein BDZ89DRAFT_152729 [Hymenopellis radicata]
MSRDALFTVFGISTPHFFPTFIAVSFHRARYLCTHRTPIAGVQNPSPDTPCGTAGLLEWTNYTEINILHAPSLFHIRLACILLQHLAHSRERRFHIHSGQACSLDPSPYAFFRSTTTTCNWAGSGMGMSPAGIGFASVVAEAAGLFEATGSMGRESDAGSDRGRVASECGRERALSLSFGAFISASIASIDVPLASTGSFSGADDNASDSPEPSSSQCASSAARRGRPPKVVEIGGHQVLQTRYA